MEVRRTVVVKLHVPSDNDVLLHETVRRFRTCANRTAQWAWNDEGRCVVNQRQAEQALYTELKAETGLHANLVQKGIKRAIDAVKAGVCRRKKGQRTSQPEFVALSATFDKRSATFYRDHVSLSTVDGRIECEFILPDDENTPHHRYLLNEEYEFRTSTLHYRDGDWFLHAVMQTYKQDPAPQTGHHTVLGVDLGIDNLAVTSTGVFWSGDEFNHWRREYAKRRNSLHQTGTRWAHEGIVSVGRKETNRLDIMLHRAANGIVAEARETGCREIIFEKLAGIRDRLPGATWHHVWAFHRLYEYVKYKAEAVGLTVKQVSPKNTSKRCSTCGFTHSDNRNGETFACIKCDYKNHADYNAAKNIGLRYLRRRQNGADGGAPVGVRLNSGTLNAKGDYIPASVEARAGVHAENPRK